MKNINLKKLVFLNIFFVAVIGAGIYAYLNKPEPRPVILPTPEDIYTGPVSTSTPVLVTIPSAGINGNIVPVGRAESGNMAVPVNHQDVGWYRHGPTPGQEGNSVLAGHVDDGKGNPAIFYNLKEVKVGDFVYVENDDGQRSKFVVREIRLIDYANPSREDLESVFGNSDIERLNLITCDGTWIPEKRTYSDRLVIFTERVTE